MELKRAIEDNALYLMGNYKRLPLVPIKGRGMRLICSDGQEYLDFIGGVATNVLGHCHPRVVVAIQKQAQRLLHVSNFFHIDKQIRLARMLVEHSFADKAFFCNTGTEAIEAAIKLVRRHASSRGSDAYEIITTEKSFHGRTLGSLAATGQDKLKEGFGPMPEGFIHVPFNDTAAIEAAITPRTAAVLVEPIQGESGVRVPDNGYLAEVRRICTERGVLMVLDEIQTGMGRTGRLFAYEHENIKPDVIALAKGLGGGMPIGAVLATDDVASAFVPGSHGSTFGGNPLATTAGIATLETLLDGGFMLDACRRMGAYMMGKLKEIAQHNPTLVREVRGKGLLQAMELTKPCAPVVEAAIKDGVLLNCTAENVIRLMPALIVTESEIDEMAEVLNRAIMAA